MTFIVNPLPGEWRGKYSWDQLGQAGEGQSDEVEQDPGGEQQGSQGRQADHGRFDLDSLTQAFVLFGHGKFPFAMWRMVKGEKVPSILQT